MLRNKALAGALAAAVLAVVVGAIGFAMKAKEATRAAGRAHGEASRAAESERIAKAETAKVLRLSDVKRLQELEADAARLWPVHPSAIPALESWIARGRALVAAKDGHVATLAQMRGRARAWTDEERARERPPHPKADELTEKSAELTFLIDALESEEPGARRDLALERVEALEPEVAALTALVEAHDRWRFDSTEDQWQHDLLCELVADLELLEASLLAEDRVTPGHGWSVPKRLAQAREQEAGFAQGGAFDAAWSDALPSIAAAYPGLDLAPQVGLVPLERDPDSGLWEFWLVATGAAPMRSLDGSGWDIQPETGLVFVLIPGGSFAMGAQAADPRAPNYDPFASRFEGPVYEREVDAFLISKYELTQAQWLRLTAQNPSQYRPGGAVGKSDVPVLLTHPVENVDWTTASEVLSRVGLLLPSEPQWEFAARAGTTSVWWTGADKESLEGAANLADRAATRAGATWQDIADWPELDDGYPVHAPVDTLAPNPYGLFHVAGNVQELCADDWVSNWAQASGQADAKVTADSDFVAHRGGNFGNKASNARSAFRGTTSKGAAEFTTGLRPARPVQ
jgi:formylglycine-generating enzyme required for sulfatase activity